MKTLFILATHGTEGFSIPVFEKLEQAFPKRDFHYDWLIGNPEALKQGVRFIDVDMNRNAPGSPNSEQYEERRAAELVQIAKEYDAVVDIHGTASDCGVCTIISLPTLGNLSLAAQFQCANNVIWSSPRSSEKGPINQHIGVPAIELECGPKDEAAIHQELYRVVAQYLERRGKLALNIEGNWYRVVGKRKKAEFPNVESWVDFTPYATQHGEVTPFLARNTYKDGTFNQLEPLSIVERLTS